MEKNPEQRFGQAIFNLGINEFQKVTDPGNPKYTLRDIHNDDDKEILNRINRQITWFDLQRKVMDGVSKVEGIAGMTVNERLFAADLMNEFDKYKTSNKSYAEYILKALKVDRESISKILGK
nr:hypothetical protein [Leptobacterium flavescens]